MNDIKEFAKFYHQITGTTSRLDKEAILKDYQNSDNVKNILHFLFNPFIVTGISERKLTKNVTLKSQSCANLSSLLEYFKKHNTGRDEDIAVLKSFTADLDEEYAFLVHGLIKKDLTLGASEKTLNKVFGIKIKEKYL